VIKSDLWSISPIKNERICANILAPKRIQTKNVSTKKICIKLSYKKNHAQNVGEIDTLLKIRANSSSRNYIRQGKNAKTHFNSEKRIFAKKHGSTPFITLYFTLA
jgi:hypothetical protein